MPIPSEVSFSSLGSSVSVDPRMLQSQRLEALGQLTGGIAHDFNNLLTVVLGNLEMISLASADPNVARLASNASEAARRGANLTSRLLTFSRHEKPKLVRVDINATIRGLEDMVRRSLGPKIEIAIDLQEGIGSIIADITQLELAILNLAINARDAMNGEGKLRITSTCSTAGDVDAGCISIGVHDNGSGMSPEILARAMEPFFTTKEVGKGTGLGLAQVHAMANQAGGTVHIESQPGKGTTVTLCLPLADCAASAVLPAPAELSLVPQGHGETVLVIEDDPDVRNYLVECIGALGYLVFGAHDAGSGLTLMDNVQPDVVIADQDMPGMTGIELAQVVDLRHPGLPVLISTGGYQDEDANDHGESARRLAGYANVIRKPFVLANLSQAIRSALLTADAAGADFRHTG